MSGSGTRAAGEHASAVTAVRGTLVWFRGDPFTSSSQDVVVHVEDGLLV